MKYNIFCFPSFSFKRYGASRWSSVDLTRTCRPSLPELSDYVCSTYLAYLYVCLSRWIFAVRFAGLIACSFLCLKPNCLCSALLAWVRMSCPHCARCQPLLHIYLEIKKSGLHKFVSSAWTWAGNPLELICKFCARIADIFFSIVSTTL